MSTHYVQPGDTIQLPSPPPENPPANVPGDISNFLFNRGWVHVGSRWEHDDKKRSDMTWEQAMACEFYEFITIGGK